MLRAPRADQAYGAAIIFTVGVVLDLSLTAIVAFAVLPTLATETFAAFSLVTDFASYPSARYWRKRGSPGKSASLPR